MSPPISRCKGSTNADPVASIQSHHECWGHASLGSESTYLHGRNLDSRRGLHRCYVFAMHARLGFGNAPDQTEWERACRRPTQSAFAILKRSGCLRRSAMVSSRRRTRKVALLGCAEAGPTSDARALIAAMRIGRFGGSFVVLGLETQRSRFGPHDLTPVATSTASSKRAHRPACRLHELASPCRCVRLTADNPGPQATHRPTNSGALTHVRAMSRPSN